MPPKPQVFKTPDGKEFSTRAEWRDYMMLTFYSFKNKVDEPEPLMKLPESIQGQMFDIADCKNSTLLVLDHTEQVQIDQVVDSKIFVAACASSIFIRNCSNCTFYTACRQLRLREVVNCKFYIYSMAEVHIEYSNGLQFAPFNGGYPDHAKHLKAANLDVKHNLWYDIYDHNDPGKTHVNWSLLPEDQYEAPWFPLGECEPAVPRTKPGSVHREAVEGNMQSFSLQQMINDATKIAVSTPPAPPAAAPVAPPAQPVQKAEAPRPVDPKEAEVVAILTAFSAIKAGASAKDFTVPTFQQISADGSILSLSDFDLTAPVVPNAFSSLVSLKISETNDLAVAVFVVQDPASAKSVNTATLVKAEGSWKVAFAQKSAFKQ